MAEHQQFDHYDTRLGVTFRAVIICLVLGVGLSVVLSLAAVRILATPESLNGLPLPPNQEAQLYELQNQLDGITVDLTAAVQGGDLSRQTAQTVLGRLSEIAEALVSITASVSVNRQSSLAVMGLAEALQVRFVDLERSVKEASDDWEATQAKLTTGGLNPDYAEEFRVELRRLAVAVEDLQEKVASMSQDSPKP